MIGEYCFWGDPIAFGGFGAIHESYGIPFHGPLFASIGNCSYSLERNHGLFRGFHAQVVDITPTSLPYTSLDMLPIDPLQNDYGSFTEGNPGGV